VWALLAGLLLGVETATASMVAPTEHLIVYCPGGTHLLLVECAELFREKYGIVNRALEQPIRRIVINAGVEGATTHRFNAATEEYMDMIEARIIDPTKVTQHGAAERGVESRPDDHDRVPDRR